jgi:hypothetical protein
LSSGWQNSHNFEVWKNFPTSFLCKWHYIRLREPRKKTCIDSFFIWLWETYTFSNELLCTKKFSFYANYLLDIFTVLILKLHTFASCCVFLHTPF